MQTIENGKDFVTRRCFYMDMVRSYYEGTLSEADLEDLKRSHCSNSGRVFYESLMTHKSHPLWDNAEVSVGYVTLSLMDWNLKSTLCLEKFCLENLALGAECSKNREVYLTFTRILQEVNEHIQNDRFDTTGYEFLDLGSVIEEYCVEHNLVRFNARDLPLLVSPFEKSRQSEKIGKSKFFT